MCAQAVAQYFSETFLCSPGGHLGLFFDEDWNSQSDTVSYGHDIECSWLLCETAELLGDEALLAEVRGCCSRMALAAIEGLQPDGSMIYECSPAPTPAGFVYDTDRHWWVQAETVVGCLNQARMQPASFLPSPENGSGRKAPAGISSAEWIQKAVKNWEYIKAHLLAPDGEWYWSADEKGIPNTRDDRAGFWKYPYHNGRMCMEIIDQ